MPEAPTDTRPAGAPPECTSIPEEENDDHTKKRHRSWARLLRKLLETGPLLCPTCRIPMKVVAVIQDPRVTDAILENIRSRRREDPFEPRAPPAA